MAKRNEHVIAIMIEPVSVGQEFIDWPLHITVVPWFPCHDDNKLDALLMEIAKSHRPFKAKVGKLEKFGPKRDVPVNLVKRNRRLNNLHNDVLDVLEKNDMSIHQKNFVGNGYQAHITHQKHAKKQKGDKLRIDSLTLIKQIRLKKTGTMVKTIVKNYELG